MDLEAFGVARVLFVMAAETEYGPNLARRFRPLITGVGPIESAVSVSSALQRLHDLGRRPDLVVSLGSAGSKRLEQGRVYQVSSVSWRDIDASAIGVEKGRTPFCDHPLQVPLLTPIQTLRTATLSTGADVVTGNAFENVDADMVDMETFAVWRACARLGVPVVGLRGISDGDRMLRGYDDWASMLPLLDLRLAEAVDDLRAALRRNLYCVVSSGAERAVYMADEDVNRPEIAGGPNS